MPSSYTTNLGVEKPATGEQAGAWGNTANTSYDTIDTAIDGNLGIAMSASTYQLATNQGGPAAPGVNRLIQWTGTQTATGTVTITPNTAKKIYYMQNKTGGSFSLIFTQGSGTTFTLQPGYSTVIYTDGLGATASVFAALDDPQFTNVLVTGNMQINGALSYGSAQTFAQSVTFNGAVALNGATTATNLTINTTGSTGKAWDIYYRASGGVLTPLALGTANQVLTVIAGPAVGWAAAAALAIGGAIAGSVANAVYFSNASNQLAQDANIVITSGTGIGIGLLPSHSLHLGNARQPEIWLDTNNPTNQYRQLMLATNTTPRWQIYCPVGAEPGGNAGSDLQVVGYNDAANATRSLFYLTRASGNVLIGSSGDPGARLAVYGDNAAQAVLMVRAAASQSAWLQEWQDSAGTNVAGMDAAGNLTVTKLTTSAGGIPAGDQTISGNLHVTGQTYSTGLINSTYGYVTGGAVGITRTINYMNSAGQPQTLQFTGGILTGAT